MRIIVVVLFWSVINLGPARAVEFTGDGLKILCVSDDITAKASCLSWLAGFGEGIQSAQRLAQREGKPMTICFPKEGLKTEQTYNTYVQFMKTYPQHGNLLASAIVAGALQK